MSPRLDWTDVPTADTYNIIISLDREFTQLVVQILGIQESYYDIANPYLDFDDIYYWKVRGGLAGFGPWSETFSFRPISVIPPVPVLLSPSNGGINVSRNPTLDWNDVGEIYNYRVQVSRYPNFSTLIFNPGVEHISQYTITNTLPYLPPTRARRSRQLRDSSLRLLLVTLASLTKTNNGGIFIPRPESPDQGRVKSGFCHPERSEGSMPVKTTFIS